MGFAMHHLAAGILAAAIVFGPPLTGPLERRIYRSNPKTPLKLATYGGVAVQLWGLAAAAVAIDGMERLLSHPAARDAWLWAPAITGLILSLFVGAFMTAGILPLIQSLRGARWRQAYDAAIRRGFADIPGLIPNTATERAAWIFLSISAGICEEAIYRGFMIGFLHDAASLPLFGALASSSLIFGLAHFYQGVAGVLRTTVAGFAFGFLFLLSGSLIPCIVLHILLDLQMAYILRPFPPVEA
jgi:membrane protease YdiL (CAAX protease family)